MIISPVLRRNLRQGAYRSSGGCSWICLGALADLLKCDEERLPRAIQIVATRTPPRRRYLRLIWVDEDYQMIRYSQPDQPRTMRRFIHTRLWAFLAQARSEGLCYLSMIKPERRKL